MGVGLLLPCLSGDCLAFTTLSYFLYCWLCGIVLPKSWPFAWLSGITSWPANCSTVTTSCPVHLLTGTCCRLPVPCIRSHVGIGFPLPRLPLQMPDITFLLIASADFAELFFCCLAHLLCGTALSTCWMSGIFLLPFHLLLDYSVPSLLFESAYSLILALLLSCLLAFMPGISITLSCPPA